MDDAVTRIDENYRSESSDLQRRVDRLCDTFEEQWQRAACSQESPPLIEEQFAAAPEADRRILLRELLLVEWEYQRGINLKEYLHRFRDDADVVRSSFEEFRNSAEADVEDEKLRAILFAVLLLQHGFASAKLIADVLDADTETTCRPLPEILVERELLSAEDARTITSLYKHHLAHHDDSARVALEVLPLCPAACMSLATHVRSPRIQMILRFLSAGSTYEEGVSGRKGSRYLVRQFHRAGGLGQVWKAEDQEIPREVALKDIKPQHSRDPDLQVRFVREAEITGKLEHPGVVPVYGLGWHPDGRPFYAMRFIQGISLGDAIKRFHRNDVAASNDPSERNLELRKLMRRFVDVCNTIEFAHSRGVLHRDIKPDNIMLGEFGETLVVDWGLARVSDEVPADALSSADGESHVSPDASTRTQHGMTIGTPAYMSPEQAEGQLDHVTTRSDVYSLGATLYCILTGRPAFRGSFLPDILAAVTRGDFPHPRHVNDRVPKGLEAVCLKAMATESSARYHSAKELREEIERWLADERVLAARETWWQRIGRWARRNRSWVQAGALAMLLVTVISVASTIVILQLLGDARESRSRAENLLDRANHSLFANQVRSASSLTLSDPGRSLEMLREHTICPERLRDFSWHYLYRCCSPNQSSWQFDEWRYGNPNIALVSFVQDDQFIVCIRGGGQIELRDKESGTLHIQEDTQSNITTATLSADRRYLATGHESGKIRIWTLEDGEIHDRKAQIPEQEHPIRKLAFALEGELIAALVNDPESTIVVWQVGSGQSKGEFKGPSDAVCLALSSDGTRMAAGGTYLSSSKRGLKIWDLLDSTNIRHDDTEIHVTSVRFSFAGNSLFVGGRSGILARFDLAREEDGDSEFHLRDYIQAHDGPVELIAFLGPQYRSIVTVGPGGTGRSGIHSPHQPVRFWNAEDLKRPSSDSSGPDYLAGLLSDVLTYDSTRDHLLTVEGDGRLTVFNCANNWRGWACAELAHSGPVLGASYSLTGDSLVTLALERGTAKPVLQHWDANTCEKRDEIELPFNGRAWVLPSGAVVDCGNPETASVLYDAVTGEAISRLPVAAQGEILAYTRGKDLIAIRTQDRNLEVWDPAKQTRCAFVELKVGDACFSTKGTELAWGTEDELGRVSVMDPQTGETLKPMRYVPGGVCQLCFSADDTLLAVAHFVSSSVPSRAGIPRMPTVDVDLFDTETFERTTTLRGHVGEIPTIAFSHDGRTIATGSRDKSIRLWNVKSGICQLTLKDHADTVYSLEFSPNDQTLASSSFDSTVRQWRGSSRAQVVENEARKVVRMQMDSIPLKRDVIEAIRENREITESVRHRSLELADAIEDDPTWLTSWSYGIASTRGYSRRYYEQALRYAQVARSLLPQDYKTLMSVGIAQYRCDKLSESLEILVQLDRLSHVAEAESNPVVLAYLVLAQFRQGREDDAQDTCRRLEAAVIAHLNEPLLQDGDYWLHEVKAVLREVDEVLAGTARSSLWFRDWSYGKVSQAGYDPHIYRRALWSAEIAWDMQTENGSLDYGSFMTLGIAQYRCGFFARSIRSLVESDRLSHLSTGASNPVTLAYLAMALFESGDEEKARLLYQQSVSAAQSLSEQPAPQSDYWRDEFEKALPELTAIVGLEEDP